MEIDGDMRRVNQRERGAFRKACLLVSRRGPCRAVTCVDDRGAPRGRQLSSTRRGGGRWAPQGGPSLHCSREYNGAVIARERVIRRQPAMSTKGYPLLAARGDTLPTTPITYSSMSTARSTVKGLATRKNEWSGAGKGGGRTDGLTGTGYLPRRTRERAVSEAFRTRRRLGPRETRAHTRPPAVVRPVGRRKAVAITQHLRMGMEQRRRHSARPSRRDFDWGERGHRVVRHSRRRSGRPQPRQCGRDAGWQRLLVQAHRQPQSWHASPPADRRTARAVAPQRPP
eukprot:scaffold227661_cov31-Tisochrysis_lutea.AAC.2